MSDGERVKRPRLERSAPIRGWSGLLRAPGTDAHGPAGGEEGPRADDIIVRSVELGYRVIDDYIKRGQTAARRMQHGTYGAGDMARDVQGVASQLVRSATDLAGAWAEFFALTTRDANGAAPRNGSPVDAAAGDTATSAPADASPIPAADSVAAAPPLRIRLAVAASRPVETALDLRPVPSDHTLVVHALRGPGAAKISDVRVEAADGSALIRVGVPADQPAGVYTGLVFDDSTNLPAGEISVVVPGD